MFSTLLTTNRELSINTKSVIVLTSRTDSFSMFSDISPGADSVITSLVTFLTVVHTLGQPSVKAVIKERAPERNVLFALFDGEAFDYIGSSRTVFDMSSGNFPVDSDYKKGEALNMSQIQTKHFSHFIELNQLGLRGNDTQTHKLFIHKNIDPNPELNVLTKTIITNAKDVPDLQFENISDGSPLPPSSLQTFLKYDNSLIGIVIANHRKEYTNKYYNSLYDDFDKLGVEMSKLAKSLTNIATIISKSIFDLLIPRSNLTENNELNITSNEKLMENLLNCYLINTSCSLFNTVYKEEGNPLPLNNTNSISKLFDSIKR